MTTWQYLLLFGSTFLGGMAGFYFQREKKGLLQILLSFSGAYILGIIALHLMPWVFGSDLKFMGLWVLAGFFIQLLLEQLSVGVEHGHIHAPRKFSMGFMFAVMGGLCIHAFVEGIPLSYYGEIHELNTGHSHQHNHLLYGIILHHIPAAFALVILLLVSNLKKSGVWICLFLFSLMSPLGALMTRIVEISNETQTGILAFALGSLLHISTVILFETDNTGHHHISAKKLSAIATGLLIAILTLL